MTHFRGRNNFPENITLSSEKLIKNKISSSNVISLQNILSWSLISLFRTIFSFILMPEVIAMAGLVQTRLVHDARQKQIKSSIHKTLRKKLVREE